MVRILVIGANGQLGREFQRLASQFPSFDFLFWGRSDIDITIASHMSRVAMVKPDILINCLAYTAVDLAEKDRKIAINVNATSVGVLAKVCASLDTKVIHFSSDYVYHNYLRRPLLESDPTRPKGVYAKSKLRGEELLFKYQPESLVFRVSWLYSIYGKNFPKTMLHLSSNREDLNVVNDQIGTPTNANDLALAVLSILDSMKRRSWNEVYGTYNYSNEGTTNWADIAKYVVKKAGSNCRIHGIPSLMYPTDAPRPRYSKLNLSKFKQTFSIPIADWKESLEICLDTLLEESQD